MKNNDKTIKRTLLCLVQLPPPVHGVTVMNKCVVESPALNEAFDVRVQSLNFANTMKDLGGISLRKLWKMLVVGLKLIGKIIRYRPSLVYFTIVPTGGAFFRDTIYVVILKIMRRKIAFHLHGKGIEDVVAHSKWKLKLYRFVFHNTHVIVLDPMLQNDLQKVYSGKFWVLPNGIPLHADATEKKINHHEPLVLLFLANLIVNKGIVDFLETLVILKKQGIPFRAKIVGPEADFSEEQLMEFLRKNALTEEVDYIGPLYGEEKYQMLRQSDVMLFPSRNEAFPLTILEAMQYGLTVISTTVGAIPSIIDEGKTGFLVAPRDYEGMVEQVKKLSENRQLLETIGKQAQSKFLKQYTESVFEENVRVVLEDIERA